MIWLLIAVTLGFNILGRNIGKRALYIWWRERKLWAKYLAIVVVFANLLVSLQVLSVITHM